MVRNNTSLVFVRTARLFFLVSECARENVRSLPPGPRDLFVTEVIPVLVLKHKLRICERKRLCESLWNVTSTGRLCRIISEAVRTQL